MAGRGAAPAQRCRYDASGLVPPPYPGRGLDALHLAGWLVTALGLALAAGGNRAPALL
jgi:hypothetical protein